MNLEEKAAIIAAIKEYLRIVKFEKKKGPKPSQILPSKQKRWVEAGRKDSMKNRNFIQMRAFKNIKMKSILEGNSIELKKKF